MLLPHESASSSIKFTLVDDPGDNDDEDCQELGTAYVDIKQCKYLLRLVTEDKYFCLVLTRDDFDSERIILESENQPIAAICLDLTIKATLEEILNDIQ